LTTAGKFGVSFQDWLLLMPFEFVLIANGIAEKTHDERDFDFLCSQIAGQRRKIQHLPKQNNNNAGQNFCDYLARKKRLQDLNQKSILR